MYSRMSISTFFVLLQHKTLVQNGHHHHHHHYCNSLVTTIGPTRASTCIVTLQDCLKYKKQKTWHKPDIKYGSALTRGYFPPINMPRPCLRAKFSDIVWYISMDFIDRKRTNDPEPLTWVPWHIEISKENAIIILLNHFQKSSSWWSFPICGSS